MHSFFVLFGIVENALGPGTVQMHQDCRDVVRRMVQVKLVEDC